MHLSAIDAIIRPRERDLGDFTVRRVLPAGPRRIWWIFVSSSLERLERAKQDWKLGRFIAVPGETESIPLPER